MLHCGLTCEQLGLELVQRLLEGRVGVVGEGGVVEDGLAELTLEEARHQLAALAVPVQDAEEQARRVGVLRPATPHRTARTQSENGK